MEWSASNIEGNLWLGSFVDQMNREKLKEKNITHILTVMIGSEPTFPEDFEYLIIRAHDKSDQDLISYFPQAHQFIKEGLSSGGGVFIHWLTIPLLSLPSLVHTSHPFFFFSHTNHIKPRWSLEK